MVHLKYENLPCVHTRAKINMNTKCFVPAVPTQAQQQLPPSMFEMFNQHIQHEPKSDSRTCKRYLTVSSMYRDLTQDTTPTTFTHTLYAPISNVTRIRVISCQVPNASPYTLHGMLGVLVNDYYNVEAPSGNRITAMAPVVDTGSGFLQLDTRLLLGMNPTPSANPILQKVNKIRISLRDGLGDPITTTAQSSPLDASEQVLMVLEVTTME